jgi:endoglucanase Acf2
MATTTRLMRSSEQAWRGVVSTAGIHGDAGADFGNSFYNDHHFVGHILSLLLCIS